LSRHTVSTVVGLQCEIELSGNVALLIHHCHFANGGYAVVYVIVPAQLLNSDILSILITFFLDFTSIKIMIVGLFTSSQTGKCNVSILI